MPCECRNRRASSAAYTGIGISETEQAGVFSKFFRAGSALRSGIPGTGLGLAISKNIVDEHGGTIRLRSRPGMGTAFTVTLPSPESAGTTT
jgi:two-component system, OmpR family, phosphate regulon sensor histidine kinase PhoR